MKPEREEAMQEGENLREEGEGGDDKRRRNGVVAIESVRIVFSGFSVRGGLVI